MNNSTQASPIILCLAHLAWDYVWQRPQHILSRLSAHYPVYYVNEPFVTDVPKPELRVVSRKPNLAAYQPQFSAGRSEVLENWQNVYVDCVTQLLADEAIISQNGHLRVERPIILWFYTPIPDYFIERLPASLVVYDVMDELAHFKGAAPDMKQREARLMARADVVFAGGRSLYEARRGAHPNLHLFPSGVDVDAFRIDETTPVAPEIAHLSGPVMGYYGVIDERLDLELIDQLAASRPEWSIVMVGPVCKIDPETLPQRPNILYTGQQPYEKLPTFLKGFDVCLMPFAINEATRFISPTKTLEYMAAGKPIVSTPVHDVVLSWSDVVSIAATAEEFAVAVAAALDKTPRARAARNNRAAAHLHHRHWDTIALQMRGHIENALGQRHAATARPAARRGLDGWAGPA